MRIDQLLVRRGLASTRSQAQRLIGAGVLWRDASHWRRVSKNGELVPMDALIELLDTSESRYVSRGGLKLAAALQVLNLDVTRWHCLDVGQSTGGFTDCLLRHGAAQVQGVDVGSGQLHAKLRADARVRCLESVNARTLKAADLLAAYPQAGRCNSQFDAHGASGEPTLAWHFDLIVVDLSFISQTLVLPSLVLLLKPGGWLLSLVKPQFELQPCQIGKGGIVKDAALYDVVQQRLRQACRVLGLRVTHWFASPITGGDGNREFFIAASKPRSGHET